MGRRNFRVSLQPVVSMEPQFPVVFVRHDPLEDGEHPWVRRTVVRQHGDRLAADVDTFIQLDPLQKQRDRVDRLGPSLQLSHDSEWTAQTRTCLFGSRNSGTSA